MQILHGEQGTPDKGVEGILRISEWKLLECGENTVFPGTVYFLMEFGSNCAGNYQKLQLSACSVYFVRESADGQKTCFAAE